MLLSIGSTGAEVTELQKKLQVTPEDGIFGSRTYQAVCNFQAENGLKVDGIVGPLTAAKLNIFPGLIAVLKDANKKFWDKLTA